MFVYITIDYNRDLEEFPAYDHNGVLLPAPYLNLTDNGQFILDEGGAIACDSEEELDQLFNLTVGDDGPTKFNTYNGPHRVYALVIDDHGNLLNENT